MLSAIVTCVCRGVLGSVSKWGEAEPSLACSIRCVNFDSSIYMFGGSWMKMDTMEFRSLFSETNGFFGTFECLLRQKMRFFRFLCDFFSKINKYLNFHLFSNFSIFLTKIQF